MCWRLRACSRSHFDLIEEKDEQAVIYQKGFELEAHRRTIPRLYGGEHEHQGCRRRSDRGRIAGSGATLKSVRGTDERCQGVSAAERDAQYDQSFAETQVLALSGRKASALWQPESPHIATGHSVIGHS